MKRLPIEHQPPACAWTMPAESDLLWDGDEAHRSRVDERLTQIGFIDVATARARFVGLCSDEDERQRFVPCLPALIHALRESASPDASLLNFERYVHAVGDRRELFTYLGEQPRAVEILVRLFVSSQFLTEILIRRPDDLQRLTRHRQLADVKHRQALRSEAADAARPHAAISEQLDAVRQFHKWELLRLGSCDLFGLMDVKTVTLQLALLADAITQVCLDLIAADSGVDPSGFGVIAMGKLGGEELNYSSDVDLIFIADREAERFWPLGQSLIRALMEATAQGFMYRVDMRLRPWGRSGPLVCTVDRYVDYLHQHGQLWEKQALLKARGIAGNQRLGSEFIERVRPIIDDVTAHEVRRNIIAMKQTVESHHARSTSLRGNVKTGPGGIRDVEFLVQGLQLIHGPSSPAVRCVNTLDGIVRLADHGYLHADEYRCLSSGYAFLRTIEHALQLTHNKQRHTLPEDPRELACLARRLDFPDADEFLHHFDRHLREIRSVFDRHFGCGEKSRERPPNSTQNLDATQLGTAAATYEQFFNESQRRQHVRLLDQLGDERRVCMQTRPLDDQRWELTVAGHDRIGDLSVICGLLFAFGYNIESGDVFTCLNETDADGNATARRSSPTRRFVDVFTVRPTQDVVTPALWKRYESDLARLLGLLEDGQFALVHGQLARRVAKALRTTPRAEGQLLPVEIGIDNDTSPEQTILDIAATDTAGFLYELTNALSLSGLSIVRMQIRSVGDRVVDVLHVTDRRGCKVVDPQKLLELRAAIVLTKHFTHLLPASPNPQKALLHFRELLERLFAQPNWINELARLQRSDVLSALARLLGVSDFLWHDVLKLQHANLFPIVTDLDALQHRRPRAALEQELIAELAEATNRQAQREVLNQFKDREMLRVDMRHILGLQRAFGLFAHELTDVAEVAVAAALRLCEDELVARHGRPRTGAGTPSRLIVCALGKCGGRELGFASDVELMFIYDGDGRTDGAEPISSLEFYESLVEGFRKAITARRQGIFEIDLRLRPYGKAGPLAVSLQAFESYFGPKGAAWPFERQALVKLRPIAGDLAFGREVVAVRDRLLYTGEPFDAIAMRAMRERQRHQLVTAGTFHAKLSPGGLVDCEYLVQGLQITHGAADESLRDPNTRQALKALEAAGCLSHEERLTLRDAYRFLRRLIDALRMVRGDARDLAVPSFGSDEFDFLARRLGYTDDGHQLRDDLERHTTSVRGLARLLDDPDEE